MLDRTRQLAQRLAHQPGLQARVGVSHLPLDLGAGDQGGHRVNDHHTGPGPHHGLGDLQCLLSCVRLRDEQVVHVHPTADGVVPV